MSAARRKKARRSPPARQRQSAAGIADTLEQSLALARQMLQAGQPQQVAEICRKILNVQPDHAGAVTLMAELAQRTGAEDKAMALYQQAASLAPADILIQHDTAAAMMRRGRNEQAEQILRAALAKAPRDPALWGTLGNALRGQRRLQEAAEAFEQVIACDPKGSAHKARASLVSVRINQGLADAAIEHLEAVLEKEPDWQDMATTYLMALQYSEKTTPQQLYDAHVAWAERFAAAKPASDFDNAPVAERTLRVGFVSPDYCRHPVATFLGPLLAERDREAFSFHAFHIGRKDDAVTEQLKEQFDHWHEPPGAAGEARKKAAETWLPDAVRKAGIDVLIDLGGHTAGARLVGFARRMAPLQVTWLGYPDTTGIAAMDYRISDDLADPEGSLASEDFLRLPESFLCYPTDRETPEIGPLPALENGYITFGSFNKLAKVSEQTVALWSRVLKETPDSRLLIKNWNLDDPATQELLIERFEAQGIDRDRLELVGFVEDPLGHLAMYNRIDIALDTTPYNGTTTTCEALSMGVPVIALNGDRHAARVGTSLLTAAGYPEWAAPDADTFVSISSRLADDFETLAEVRSGLRSHLYDSALCDAERFAADFQTSLRGIWRKWCDSQSDVAPEKAALQRMVQAKPFWYHKIALPHGVTTPGWAPIKADAYGIPADLTGKRVLDVGAWDGYWSFEALKRGAREVVAIDDFSDYLGILEERDRNAWENFDLCRQALGHGEDVCKRVEMSVYDVSEEKLGRFDVVFFFGTLYHLRYPLLALDKLASVCDREIFVESAVSDDFSPYKGANGPGGFGSGHAGRMVMEFYPGTEYGKNDTNWWAPTVACMAGMVRAAGFDEAKGWKLTDTPQQLPHCRGYVHGRRTS